VSSVLEFESRSEEDTLAFGRRLGPLLPTKAVVLLIGDLGTGKTTLVKGIVEGRGAAGADEVSSPTFTLIHEYGDPVSVYHADLYRLDTAQQARGLGLEDIYDMPALLLIEWGDRFPELIPEKHIAIRLCQAGENVRRMQVSGLSG
jgi:tRNA threonylcarbamoyladenosine biosynthesis protein TsaE